MFNLLCAPCFAAIGAIRREMNSAKWTWFAIGYQCGFAYICALLVSFIGGIATGNPIGSASTLVILLVLLFVVLRILASMRKKKSCNGKCGICGCGCH